MSIEKEMTDEPLIKQLVHLCSDKNRGNRAELRRYWSPGTRHYAYPHLGRLGILGGKNKANEIVAALFAEHPEHKLGGQRFGQAALNLAGGSPKANEFDSFERHFRRLLACDAADLEELGRQIHRIVKRMSKKSIVFDYNRLLWDLRRWESKSEDVKTNWARDFWQAPYEIELAEAANR